MGQLCWTTSLFFFKNKLIGSSGQILNSSTLYAHAACFNSASNTDLRVECTASVTWPGICNTYH